MGKNVGMFQNLNDFHEIQINNAENILNEDEPNLDEEINIQWFNCGAINKIALIKEHIN